MNEIAEKVVRYALHYTRAGANRNRLAGLGHVSDYFVGSVDGQLLVAEFDLHADPVLIQAARNEHHFLSYDYARRSA